MNAQLLAGAVRARTRALLDSDFYDDAPRDARELMRDVAELALVAARIAEGKPLDRAFGAPGDWGYETQIGAALAAAPDPSVQV